MPLDTSIAVLIVDDYQSMRRTIADIMRHLGFRNLFYAEDGKQALRRLAETPIQLVILDWDMPNVTGIEVLREMRNNADWKDIPVCMVTAEAHRENVMEAIKIGVTNYVVKPFTPQTLEKKLIQVLSKPAVSEAVPFKPPAA
jgi:two-component system chemotaxis response regulator CheY